MATLHLFLFEEDQESLISLFQDPLLESCLVTKGQFLFRYLISAMLLQKNFNFQLITDILERQLVSTDELMIQFIKSLLIDCDFEKCQTIIKTISVELKNDFFLHTFTSQIVENA